MFNAVGIYMLLDVNSPLPGESLNRGDPASSYNSDYLSRIFGVVEAFKDYPNTLGFFGGNEVINDGPSGGTIPPYLRAVTRDLKNYVAKHASRTIPVGYSAADVREILLDTWKYLQCATNNSPSDPSRIDFFGLNSYSWCGGGATFQTSGYDVLVSDFSNTSVPIFFSEYGCNHVQPRVFAEVEALYGPQMTAVMSGGIVYEYTQETSDYGLVSFNDNGTASLRTDYDNLQDQYNKLNVSRLESGNLTATTIKPPTCNGSLITTDAFYNNFSIPAVPAGAQRLIDNGIPSPNRGKLVDIKPDALKVPQTVYASNGNPIQNLAIKPLPNDQSNTPNGQDTSGDAKGSGTATAGAAAPTASKKGGAGRWRVSGLLLGAVVAVAVGGMVGNLSW